MSSFSFLVDFVFGKPKWLTKYMKKIFNEILAVLKF